MPLLSREFSQAYEPGLNRKPDAVLGRCNAIITVNEPEEKTWIPD